MARRLTPLAEEPARVTPKLTLRLLRNCFVNGEFGRRGEKFTFPSVEARKRLQMTSGVWEAI